MWMAALRTVIDSQRDNNDVTFAIHTSLELLSLYCPVTPHILAMFPLQSYEVSPSIAPIFQIRKLRLSRAKAMGLRVK